MRLFHLLSLQSFISFAFGKMEIYLDEKIEKCVDAQDDAGYLDLSDFFIVAESDTSVFLNGSVRFLKTIESPWKVHMVGEKFERGEWNVYAFNKKVADFCAVMHSPAEVWYPYFKDFNGCPIEAGVSSFNILINMESNKMFLEPVRLEVRHVSSSW